MNIKGRLYRAWSKFIHKHGYHYAPRKHPIEGHLTKGLGNTEIKNWSHWCHWCGLRGSTIEIPQPASNGRELQ